MPICPYCEMELDIKMTLKPVEFDEDFKNGIIQVIQSQVEIQAEMMPFGGKMARNFSQIGIKYIHKYFEMIKALPVVIISCKHCNKVISSDIFQSADYSPGRSK